MTSAIKVVTSPFLDVLVSSTTTSFHSERRFQKSLTIAELKVHRSFNSCYPIWVGWAIVYCIIVILFNGHALFIVIICLI